MTKINKPEEIFPDITGDYSRIYGKNLVSIILYGSAAGMDYRPGKSDLNFLVVLSEESIDHLDRALETVSKWRKKGVATPLFMTKSYITSSLDSYPLEFLNMQTGHILVYGEDVLGGISFEQEKLRLQCEREIKGKLLLLRERFLETEGRTARMRSLIEESITAFISIFRGLLYLRRIEIPSSKREIVEVLEGEISISGDTFLRCMDVKELKKNFSSAEIKDILMSYLVAVRKLWGTVDTMQ